MVIFHSYVKLPEGTKNIHQLSPFSYPPPRGWPPKRIAFGFCHPNWAAQKKSPVAQHFDGYKASSMVGLLWFILIMSWFSTYRYTIGFDPSPILLVNPGSRNRISTATALRPRLVIWWFHEDMFVSAGKALSAEPMDGPKEDGPKGNTATVWY